jgi:hypothetical protein
MDQQRQQVSVTPGEAENTSHYPSHVTDEQIMYAASTHLQYLDCTPQIHGREALISFARDVLKLSEENGQ